MLGYEKDHENGQENPYENSKSNYIRWWLLYAGSYQVAYICYQNYSAHSYKNNFKTLSGQPVVPKVEKNKTKEKKSSHQHNTKQERP